MGKNREEINKLKLENKKIEDMLTFQNSDIRLLNKKVNDLEKRIRGCIVTLIGIGVVAILCLVTTIWNFDSSIEEDTPTMKAAKEERQAIIDHYNEKKEVDKNVEFFSEPKDMGVVLKDEKELEVVSGWDLLEMNNLRIYSPDNREVINRTYDYYKVGTKDNCDVYSTVNDIVELQVIWAFNNGYDIYFEGNHMDELYPDVMSRCYMYSLTANETTKTVYLKHTI